MATRYGTFRLDGYKIYRIVHEDVHKYFGEYLGITKGFVSELSSSYYTHQKGGHWGLGKGSGYMKVTVFEIDDKGAMVEIDKNRESP